jgi:hypothetical protein
MISFKSIFFLFFLCFSSSIVVGQVITYYTAYRTSFLYVTSCPSRQYYDIALLQCSACPTNATQKSSGNKIIFMSKNIKLFHYYLDQTQCDCVNNTFYYGVNQGGGSLICKQCNSGYVRMKNFVLR